MGLSGYIVRQRETGLGNVKKRDQIYPVSFASESWLTNNLMWILVGKHVWNYLVYCFACSIHFLWKEMHISKIWCHISGFACTYTRTHVCINVMILKISYYTHFQILIFHPRLQLSRRGQKQEGGTKTWLGDVFTNLGEEPVGYLCPLRDHNGADFQNWVFSDNWGKQKK